MDYRLRFAGLVTVVGLFTGADLLACGDKFLVAGRGTRYQRPRNARAASILIYAEPASGLPATVGSSSVESVLKREGHRFTRVETLDQLAAVVTGGRFDVVLAASTAAAAVEDVLSKAPDAPVVVAVCVKASLETGQRVPCAVKAPPKERSLLQAIDKAVERRDRNTRRT